MSLMPISSTLLSSDKVSNCCDKTARKSRKLYLQVLFCFWFVIRGEFKEKSIGGCVFATLVP